MAENDKKGAESREYEKEEEDESKKEKKKLNHGSWLNKPMKGAPPPLSKCGPNCIEDRVPYVCLHIGTHIFIEAFPRAGVVAGDFECFAYLEIVW